MSISRLPSLSSLHRSRQALNSLTRFGARKKLQSRSPAISSRCYHEKPDTRRSVQRVIEEASQSSSIYILPMAVLGFAGIAAFIHYNDESRAIPKGNGKDSIFAAEGPVIGGPFTLVDTENQIVTEQNLKGKWVLLYFGYTSSPDVGPEQVQTMCKAVDILEESKRNMKVLPIFITIDPQRDTPSQLRAYLKEFDSRVVGLTGPVSAVRQMAHEYRVFFKKVEEDGDDYLIESSHNMYLINPNMEVARCFSLDYNAKELAEAIVKELKRTPTS